MVFSSPIFFFFFLPLTLLAYFASPRRGRNAVLLAASVVFYAWGEMRYIPLLAGSVVSNYLGGMWVSRAPAPGARLRRLWIMVALNLSALAWFKYAGFVAASINAVARLWGIWPPLIVPQVLLPLGISFFTFHAISYLVDVYRQKVRPQRNPWNFALYIVMFPQLIAGPIIRYHDIESQLDSHQTRFDDFAEGVRRIVIGLAKKVLVANPLGEVADAAFGTTATGLSTEAAWLGALCYMAQIYFDFSGYSDMAIGLCRLFGFRILENFNYPYVSQSIQEFWRRWHISLSNWFRDYVYISLGGNRYGKPRTYVNLIVVFFLCGLWHGASWTFVAWGLYHGAFLVIERSGFAGLLARLPRAVRHLYAFLVIIVGWVLFRSGSFAQAATLLRVMFVPSANGLPAMQLTDGLRLGLLVVAAVCATPLVERATTLPAGVAAGTSLAAAGRVATLMALTVLSFLALAANTYNPFIYFRF